MKGQNVLRNYFTREISCKNNTTSFLFYSSKRLSIDNEERKNKPDWNNFYKLSLKT